VIILGHYYSNYVIAYNAFTGLVYIYFIIDFSVAVRNKGVQRMDDNIAANSLCSKEITRRTHLLKRDPAEISNQVVISIRD